MTRAIVIAMLVAASTVHAAPPAARVAYVARALAAVHALGPAGRADLDRDVYAAARARCHADSAAPTAPCLIDAARALCGAAPDRAGCDAATDVIAANLRSVDDFVDERTRVLLVRGATDYHAALAAELRRRYALLAAELALASNTGEGADAAASIDRLCAERDRAVHACEPGAAACIPSLPWSRCVAALVWYVGGAP